MPDTAPASFAGGPAGGCREALTPERIDAVLAEFRAWLESLPADDRSAFETEADPPVDLATIAAAFTALRHEIHLHTKAARAQSEQAGLIADQLQSQLERVGEDDHSEKLVASLLESADVLIRAEAGLRRALVETAPSSTWRRWFAPRQDAMVAAVEGVAIGVQRLERLLKSHGLEAIPSVGLPFDPDTMEVVEVVDGASARPGTVVEEIRRGYRRDGNTVRIASVKVARGPFRQE